MVQYTKSNNKNNIIHKYYNTCVTIPIVTIINILQKNTRASLNCPKKQQQNVPIGKNCLSETAEWNVSSEPAANMMHYFLLSGNNYSRAMYVARQLSFGGNNSRPRNASIKLFWWHVKIYAHLIHTHDQNQADLFTTGPSQDNATWAGQVFKDVDQKNIFKVFKIQFHFDQKSCWVFSFPGHFTALTQSLTWGSLTNIEKRMFDKHLRVSTKHFIQHYIAKVMSSLLTEGNKSW